METNNLLDAEFKTTGYKDAQSTSENLNSIKNDMGTIKKNQSKMKDTLTGMKNNLQGINSREDEAKNEIRDL